MQWLCDVAKGRGVDVVIEAGWGGEAVEQAIVMSRPAGRVVLVGIPRDDRCAFAASVARRKGLSVLMARRMKAVYPEGISLVESGHVDVESLITQRFALSEADEAFELVASLRDGVCKAMIEIGGA